jgi:ubiquitin thioesterase OTU1
MENFNCNEYCPIRREVDADNSCLFSSIAYLIDRTNYNEFSSIKYREMIVNHLINNEFDSSLLDQPKKDYINYIQNPTNWGGALEVKMFSDIFQIQIICIDVKTNRADIFGEDIGYPQRIYLLYNGIHYDPLVMNIDVSYDSITDITIFNSNDDKVFELMKSLTYEYKDKGDFIDFAILQCKDCNEKFANETDAFEHSMNTEHWTFV